MLFQSAGFFSQGQGERQRQVVKNWILRLAQQENVVTGQTVSAAFLDTLLLPAQSVVQFTLDEPTGERIALTAFPNGSIKTEIPFEVLNQLGDVCTNDLLLKLAECISDLFHEDVLQYSHALVHNESAEYVLRSVSTMSSVPDLSVLTSEIVVLKEILLEYLQALLLGTPHAD